MDGLRKIRKIGKGGFGTVYLCQRHPDDRIVLKESRGWNGRILEAARNEVRILRELDHPNVIKLLGYFARGDRFCILMEYAEHGSLFDYIQSHRAKDEYVRQQTVLYIFCQVLLGVRHVHRKNVLHRDLKPDNILLLGSRPLLVKVADFGISKLAAAERSGNAVCAGTANYLPPEIHAGRPYDGKCDVWSLGCVLYEICALHRMFDGPMSSMLYCIRRGLIKDVNPYVYQPHIQSYISQMLRVNPKRRPSVASMLGFPAVLSQVQRLFSLYPSLQRDF